MPEEKEDKKAGLTRHKESLKEWLRDLVDVLVTLGVILVILRVLLGAHMIVPLVVVTTGSMVHHEGSNSWIAWLNERGVANETVMEMPLGGGFNVGDMMVTMRPEAGLGDVIIYQRDSVYGSPDMEPIIHRVVGIVYVNESRVVGHEGTLDCFGEDDFQKYVGYVDECRVNMTGCPYPAVPESASYRFYITKGDANTASDQCAPLMKISIPVNEAQVPAKAWLRLPYVGWLKLIMNAVIRLLTFRF